MFLSIDPENLKSVAQNAQRVNADIDSAMQLLNQISAHNDWNCKERKQLNEYTVQNKNKIRILKENSDEPYADILAKNIYSFIRSGMEVETTRQLYKIIDKTLNFIEDKNRKDIVNKTAARVFQALRIEVNQEFEVLYEFVEKLPHILKPGGRVAILTFHSGEDRIVKKTFKEMKNSGVYEDVCRNVIRPTKEECHRNSRAKSTKMRWAIKAK